MLTLAPTLDTEIPDLLDALDAVFATPAQWTTRPHTVRADYKKKTGSSDTNHTYDTTAV